RCAGWPASFSPWTRAASTPPPPTCSWCSSWRPSSSAARARRTARCSARSSSASPPRSAPCSSRPTTNTSSLSWRCWSCSACAPPGCWVSRHDRRTGQQMTFYTINLLIYAAVDAMACLGLSQQFGIAGVTNFGFIIFQAAGGYAAAILAMPPQSANGGFQTYIGGWNLPFPVPWIGAAVVGGVIALPFTFLVGRRLRGDFAAVGLLVTAVLLNLVVTNYRPLFNGDAGLSLIPQPLQGVYNPQSSGYQWTLTAVAIVLCALVYLFVRRITESPYGRSLRAMRDNDAVADSLGKTLLSLRTAMLVTGGAIAGLSGGILVSYITTWSPAAWGYAETVVLFAAVIIGGAGNHRGAVLGAILVPVGFEEITRYI